MSDGRGGGVIGLIRHGETRWNREKRIQGWQDTPLTRTGEAMARRWGKELASLCWQRLACSDLGRAMQTAGLINSTLSVPFETDARLREQDWGEWSGRTLAELRHHFGEEVRFQERRGWDFMPPQGESRHQVLQRSLQALSSLDGRYPGENILVVCHEGVIKCLLYHLAGRKFLPEEGAFLARGYWLHRLRFMKNELELEAANALRLWSP